MPPDDVALSPHQENARRHALVMLSCFSEQHQDEAKEQLVASDLISDDVKAHIDKASARTVAAIRRLYARGAPYRARFNGARRPIARSRQARRPPRRTSTRRARAPSREPDEPAPPLGRLWNMFDTRLPRGALC